MTTQPHSYLALGDSYTIGEGVPIQDSFPCQTVQVLRSGGVAFTTPEIVAKTGWTTGELRDGIAAARLLPGYDFVSLLIGVNNEYRGRSRTEYAAEFEGLLLQAIGFAGGHPSHVFVLSIPDWSVTPFAHANLPDQAGRSREIVAREIDAFNASGREIAGKYQVDFIDITGHTRSHSWFAPDGLHPSGLEYRHWARLLAGRIMARIS
jgi:lysophospholipase L1-like esterase